MSENGGEVAAWGRESSAREKRDPRDRPGRRGIRLWRPAGRCRGGAGDRRL